jgi:hypothetical protein
MKGNQKNNAANIPENCRHRLKVNQFGSIAGYTSPETGPFIAGKTVRTAEKKSERKCFLIEKRHIRLQDKKGG